MYYNLIAAHDKKQGCGLVPRFECNPGASSRGPERPQAKACQVGYGQVRASTRRLPGFREVTEQLDPADREPNERGGEQVPVANSRSWPSR